MRGIAIVEAMNAVEYRLRAEPYTFTNQPDRHWMVNKGVRPNRPNAVDKPRSKFYILLR